MAIQEYKIVNATQLDSDLAELASKYRDTFGISATTPLTFPESFIETIGNIEKRDRNSLILVDKNITALAGYYEKDATFVLPENYIDITPVTKSATDVTLEGKTVTVSAGYYTENIKHNLPDSYVDTTDIVVTEIPDTATIAAALPAGTSITIPAGYYPNAIVITSSQSPEETPAE